jgi:hypothetical protein
MIGNLIKIVFLKILNLFLFRIYFLFLYGFDVLMLKIFLKNKNIYYFDILKKHFKKQPLQYF